MIKLQENIIVTNIHTIARINLQPGYHYFPHTLPHNELIFKLEGNSKISIGGKEFKHPPGTVRYMPANVDMRSYSSNIPDEGSNCIDIFFDTNVPLAPEFFAFNSTHIAEIKRLFLDIDQVWARKQTGYHAKCMSLLYRILNLVIKTFSTEYLPSVKHKMIEPGIS